jgi:hypothetical protein
VKLRRSQSEPGKRQDEDDILTFLRADAFSYGAKGASLAAGVRAHIAREKLARALKEGNMVALRGAVRTAQWGSKLHSDPTVKQAHAIVSKYDKIVRECKSSLTSADANMMNMIRLQTAMDDMNRLVEHNNLGPQAMEHPVLAAAREELAKMAPFRPYLYKLEQSWYKGAEHYAMYWLVVYEGMLLSAELETKATSNLSILGAVGEQAFEKALKRPELRYHYRVAWSETVRRNALPQQVLAQIARFGFDVGPLKTRLAKDRKIAAAEFPEEMASVVIMGPDALLEQIRQFVEGRAGEPRAGAVAEIEAFPDTKNLRELRVKGHRDLMNASKDKMLWEAGSKPPTASGSRPTSKPTTLGDDLIPSSTPQFDATNKTYFEKTLKPKAESPAKGPWYGSLMFTATQ